MRTLTKLFAALTIAGASLSIPAYAGYGTSQGCHIEYFPIKHKVCSYGPLLPRSAQARSWR